MAKKLIKPTVKNEDLLRPDHFKDGQECISDEKIVVTTGYVPPRFRIERMFAAGDTLTRVLRGEYEFKNRKGVYDFDNMEVDHELRDPTRQRGFDMADATQLAYANQEKILRQNDEFKRRQIEELAKAKETQQSSVADPDQNQSAPPAP